MAKVNIPEYPDNSIEVKETAPAPVDIPEESKDLPSVPSKKVIQGSVTKKKKSVFRKIKETFFVGNKEDVGNYLITDVLLPSAKETLRELADKGLDMMMYGDTRATPYKRSKSGGSKTREYVSYDQAGRRESIRTRRDTLNFDDIILESRGDAERVLDDLLDKLEEYKVATVADLYDAVDISHDFSHTKYGWYDLSSAYVKRTRDGYVVVLPKAEVLT